MNDIGHNQPPIFDTLSLRKDELLAGMNRLAKELPQLTTQADCDKVADFKRQMIALRDEIELAFEEEKHPWLVGSRAVDDKWRMMKAILPPFIRDIEAKLTAGLKRLSAIREQERLAAEEKLRLEQEAADRITREAEDLKAKADAGELTGMDSVDVVLKVEQAITAKENVRAASKAVTALKGNAKAGTGAIDGRKRSAGLRASYSAKITKPLAALGYFSEHPKIQEVLQEVANAKVREIMAGKPGENPAMPPGIELVTEQRAV